MFDSVLRRFLTLALGFIVASSATFLAAQPQQAPTRTIIVNLQDSTGPVDRFFDLSVGSVLALSGATPAPLLPMPVRAAFGYKKKLGRREYVRASLRKAADGTLEAVKFAREGAGLLSSLVDTDGLIELGESIVRVEPGDQIGFLGYAELL